MLRIRVRVNLELVESLADSRERVAAMLCSMVGALLGRPAGRSVAIGPPTPCLVSVWYVWCWRVDLLL